MHFTRRQLLGAAGAAFLAAPMPLRAQPGAASLDPVAGRVRAFAEAVLARNGFPGMSIALVGPGGWSAAFAVGLADLDSRAPATAGHLFQIGSITKSLTAMAVFALAGRGRLDLDATVRDLLPDVPLPREPIALRHLLEHSSGLPNSLEPTPFLDVPGGSLWTGFPPGSRYSYCNLGYTLLGLVVERAASMPFAAALQRLVLTPLGMTGARPVIRTADRAGYAVGHARLRDDIPWLPGAPLTEARWLDMQSAAGSVGAAAGDMVRYIEALVALGRGRGAPLFSDALAERYRTPTIASDHGLGARYGNGLVTLRLGGRPVFRHTGGMIGFSSAVTVDAEAGIGAYASVNVGGAGGYRPIEVSEYALALLRAAADGTTAPPQPEPQAGRPIPEPLALAGQWVGPEGQTLSIHGGDHHYSVTSGGVERPLVLAGAGALATDHPALAPYLLVLEDGPEPLLRIGDALYGRGAAPPPQAADPRLVALAGRYYSAAGWAGRLNIFAFRDRLYLGPDRLVEAQDGSWRFRNAEGAAERLWFRDVLGGRPQTLNLSGTRFSRQTG